MAQFSGSIVGLGHDFEQVVPSKLAHLRETPGVVFTAAELTYIEQRPQPDESAFGIFAAKEATFKALPTLAGLHWTDIEIDHEASGAPTLRPAGALLAHFSALNLVAHVSIAHSGCFASAVVLISQRSV